MAERLTRLPHQYAQASLSTGAEGFENVVGRSEKDVCIRRELGSNATRSPG